RGVAVADVLVVEVGADVVPRHLPGEIHGRLDVVARAGANHQRRPLVAYRVVSDVTGGAGRVVLVGHRDHLQLVVVALVGIVDIPRRVGVLRPAIGNGEGLHAGHGVGRRGFGRC